MRPAQPPFAPLLGLAMALAVTALSACGSGRIEGRDPGDADETDEEPDLTDLVYEIDHLMAVEITMDPDDWDTLRNETRTLADTIASPTCQDEPFANPFHWFEAAVTVDGQEFDRVEVRKKGFLGSMNERKPSLKLDLGEFDDTLNLHGVRRITLNNSVSDPSLLRQCVAYAAFNDAGVPAPRCSMATVSVNGVDKGVFANIEPVKEPFLARTFGDDAGNLYEGTLSDFRDGWTGSFDKKTNEEADDWADIQRLVTALEADDDALLDALEPVVDVDAFLTFWAMEIMVKHVDGYAWNTNNYYIYADPKDGRFRFIPWGVDAVFYSFETGQGAPPETVYAFSALTNRLYAHPEGREMYLDRLDSLLEGSWNEDENARRINVLRDTIEPALGGSEWLEVNRQIDALEDILAERRGDIDSERDRGEVEWPYGMRDTFCMEPSGNLTASFETTWGSVQDQDAFAYGDASIDVVWEDDVWPTLDASAVAGAAEEEAVLYLPVWTSETTAYLVYAVLPESDFVPGVIELDMDRATGAIFYLDADISDDWTVAAYILGTLTFDQAGTDYGDVLTGDFEGELLAW